MRIQILVVGRARGALADVIREYEGRAGHYWKLEVEEVDEGAPGRDPDPERVRAQEADRILARIPQGFEVFALTREGRGMGSRALADHLSQAMVQSVPGVSFVIGGAFGLDSRVLARANRQLSLSDMTFPHEMARLMLVEQIYRAGTILRNEPYHKGA